MKEDYGIYRIWFTDSIYESNDLIGKEIEIVKGRKYPIGSKHIIKSFSNWVKPNSYGKISTLYIITNEGLKIDSKNCKLTKSTCNHERVESYLPNPKTCPNCKASKNHIIWHGDGYKPSFDVMAHYYNCNVCGLDLWDY